MCAVSMIADHYHDKWSQPPYIPNAFPYLPIVMPTAAEIAEFHKLLDRAREYDKKYNQPDCELEEKKQKLTKLAKELGINISFE